MQTRYLDNFMYWPPYQCHIYLGNEGLEVSLAKCNCRAILES